jgi:prepilin-type N-terminal cleavage/methylation domain-containing protein
MKIRNNNKGFTIVELLIVIVVIGILAALVITTFTGIQQRARDTERQTDIVAVHGHLEVFYANNSYYPTVAELIPDNLPGIDAQALVAPRAEATDVIDANVSTIVKYQYAPLDSDNADCTTSTECISYTLTAVLEATPAEPFSKTSLN